MQPISRTRQGAKRSPERPPKGSFVRVCRVACRRHIASGRVAKTLPRASSPSCPRSTAASQHDAADADDGSSRTAVMREQFYAGRSGLGSLPQGPGANPTPDDPGSPRRHTTYRGEPRRRRTGIRASITVLLQCRVRVKRLGPRSAWRIRSEGRPSDTHASCQAAG
jgi:hypothetical protein